ncbi:MAG: sn-glycerol-3-phosphate ABC transporter ATP-binding protein UgpC [Actinomycetota bacterium]|nr:sn-glycerol-3-phosphate ABC transporter ATP-binding protein UgpC [Actinomycetota bacterium]
MADIVMDNVTKRYPDGFEAVRDMDLEIKDGEFVILVGPSGSGKSTALRMIAGLEDISDGELKIGGDVVNDKAPKDRDIAMVFQNYALYPHMTVRENMGFALKLAGVDKAEINRKVEEAAKILDLSQHLDRRPANLSGGQRQRVAMGRAIVREPAAFLMDEPLSNLDAKLRVQTRTELARIQQRLGTTTVYVTHDQTEAMTLGDRVAVMRGGVLQQVDTPMELYNNPKNLFVAGFIGSPAMNFMPATLDGDTVKLPMADVRLPRDVVERAGHAGGTALIAGIRPENFEDASLVGDAEDQGVRFRTKIDVLESLGSELYAHFSVTSQESIQSAELRELAEDSGAGDVPAAGEAAAIVARLDPTSQVKEGQDTELWLDATKVHLFDPEDGRSLTASHADAPAAVAPGAQSTTDED